MHISFQKDCMLPEYSAISSALSAALRATVRTVPSVGFITDLYAASTPISIAFAICMQSAVSSPANPLENPLKSSDRITPEFPRAPLKSAEAAISAACDTVILSSASSSSLAAADIVIDIFVPVSPSGTG